MSAKSASLLETSAEENKTKIEAALKYWFGPSKCWLIVFIHFNMEYVALYWLHVSGGKETDILSENIEQERTGAKKALPAVLGSQQLSNIALMNMNAA